MAITVFFGQISSFFYYFFFSLDVVEHLLFFNVYNYFMSLLLRLINSIIEYRIAQHSFLNHVFIVWDSASLFVSEICCVWITNVIIFIWIILALEILFNVFIISRQLWFKWLIFALFC